MRHMNTVHEQFQYFQCPKCPKAFTTFRSMKNHKAIHNQSTESDICQIQEDSLQSDILRVDIKEEILDNNPATNQRYFNKDGC